MPCFSWAFPWAAAWELSWAAAYGWRTTFFIYAVPGVVLIPLILMMKEPARGASEEGAVAAATDNSKESVRAVMKRILGLKSLPLQYSVALFTQFGLMSFSVWMPTYLVRFRGFEINEAGKIMGAAFVVGGIVGAIGGGAIADRWFKKDKSARIKVQTLALGLTIPFLLTAMLLDSQAVFIPSIFLVSILATACYPVCTAILVDVLNPKDRGVGMSFLLIVQNGIGLTLASLLVGAVSDLTGNLLNGMMIAPFAIAAAMLISMSLKNRYLSDHNTLAAAVAAA